MRQRMRPSAYVCVSVLLCAAGLGALAGSTQEPKKKIAAVVTAYYHNSHADVIVSKLFRAYTLDDKGELPTLELASLYTDQVPKNDISRKLAAKYGFPIYDTVAEALTLGTGKLAVDGVLLVAEHGKYPRSETGSIQYPKRRLFGEVAKVFEASKAVVPLFVDKHLADNWKDAKWLHDTAQRMTIPLMAGSSLPVFWRRPPADVRKGTALKEVVAVSYHTLDAYGFHALEMVQCLVERRLGGETGVRAVQCLVDDDVWEAGPKGVYDGELLTAALGRLKRRPVSADKLKRLVKRPVLFVIDYADGLRANVFTLNYAVSEWAVAWRYKDGKEMASTLFEEQDGRPATHFTHLVKGIEGMMQTGRPSWPAERTLLTSGTLDALLISKKEGGKHLETPYLTFSYGVDWAWQQPPPPPPTRPWRGE